MDIGNAASVIKIGKAYAQAVNDVIPIEAVYLFGSYAKGTNKTDSDIDIAVVSNAFAGDPIQDRLSLMKLRRGIDLRIEPHPFLTEDLTTENPFIHEIISTGIRIM